MRIIGRGGCCTDECRAAGDGGFLDDCGDGLAATPTTTTRAGRQAGELVRPGVSLTLQQPTLADAGVEDVAIVADGDGREAGVEQEGQKEDGDETRAAPHDGWCLAGVGLSRRGGCLAGSVCGGGGGGEDVDCCCFVGQSSRELSRCDSTRSPCREPTAQTVGSVSGAVVVMLLGRLVSTVHAQAAGVLGSRRAALIS